MDRIPAKTKGEAKSLLPGAAITHLLMLKLLNNFFPPYKPQRSFFRLHNRKRFFVKSDRFFDKGAYYLTQ